MSTALIVIIIVAAVVVVALVALALRATIRRRHLRERFGPEYERTVQAEHSRRAAERDLSAREQRHEDLEIRPLPSTVRSRYARDWNSVQEHFVDGPDRAVGEADQLVTTLMGERGYPTEGRSAISRLNTPKRCSTTAWPTRSTVAPETGTPQPRNCGAPWSTTAPCLTNC